VRVQLDAVFVPLNIAVLTVSDTRTYDNDTSGALLANRSVEVGHRLVARALLKDDLYKIRAQVASWIADEQVQGCRGSRQAGAGGGCGAGSLGVFL